MAYMVPEVIRSSATVGERLLFRTLKEHLPDDYMVYYEPEIQGKRPDFVIIGPDLGLVVLEVKDYTKQTLHQINQDEWTLHTASGRMETVKNPFKQARDYAHHISNQLRKDQNLVQLEGNYRGLLKFPYGYGTVFTRLKQEDFIKHDLYSIISPEYVLCRDEIDAEEEGFSAEILIEKIQGMFTIITRRSYILTADDIHAIRYHLFPEVRISAEIRPPSVYQDQLLLSLHNIKTMDLHQESMAKQLGDKHRLIRGVAGSGKTLVLASRAKILAKQHPEWRILVLCYGIPLSRSLQQMIDRKMDEPEDLLDWGMAASQAGSETRAKHNIEVYNFHEWLSKVMKTSDHGITELLERLERKEAIVPAYEAILIDEGQDFEPDWLKLLSYVLNPDTKNLLLVEDRAQAIFKRKSSLLQNTGIDFRGRSRILSINYRNTAQIVQFAWDFYQRHSVLKRKVQAGSTTDGVEIIPPQSTKRKGPEPVIMRCGTFQEEMDFVIKQVAALHKEKKVPLSEIVILYRVKKNYRFSYVEYMQRQLAKHNLPFNWITQSADSKRDFDRSSETIKISTIDSAKGLDFQAVFIVNAENMPFALEEVEEREVSLFYIGMTRALDWLHISYSGDSKFTLYLDEVRNSSLKKQSAMPLKQR